ncbi:TetR/AcrR family transcriptional regulator [Cryptosporangium arvum]|uniref:Transcriptional regulator n=1 Tax=Cryptosporangium arvum DSM 44712 TaxID=927661 RepID=A0A010Z1H7_9ACTN|nr:TetR family transcriptional regulator [Cryptosporangium arvum]EXG81253.1 transcriptional regulator [Cryptosporangium arvum DSM 44712]
MFVTIMFMPPRRTPVSRRDRPAKPPLSRDGVVAVALGILREEGLERVTMRRLAAELDTGPASLYVYVQNMAELHGALLDALLADFPLTASDPVDLLVDYTTLLLEYPSLARSVLTLWPSGPNYLRVIDALLGRLAAAGIAPRPAAWGVDILLQHATASAAEHGTRRESPVADGEWEGLRAAVRDAPDATYPHIAAHRDALVSGAGEQRLRWAFAALVNGIAATG